MILDHPNLLRKWDGMLHEKLHDVTIPLNIQLTSFSSSANVCDNNVHGCRSANWLLKSVKA